MHIIVVEDDHFEIEIAMMDIVARFPQAKLTSVRTVGDFLLSADELRTADLVVMEHFLPLGRTLGSEEETTTWFKRVVDRSPEIVEAWNHQEGGERLLRWMRKNGMEMPVLFHTHSDLEDLAEDVRSDRAVFYLQKACVRNLGEAINQTLEAR
jgi:CheY-like chemotaxis protein